MSKKFSNPYALTSSLEFDLGIVLMEIATDVLMDWKALVQQRLYDGNWLKQSDIVYYDRTRQMVDALVKSAIIKIGSKLEVEIYYDASLIESNFTGQGFNEHMNFNGGTSWNGVPIKNLMPYFIEEGQTSSVLSYDGIQAREDIMLELDNEFVEMFKVKLEKIGVKIK